MSTETASAHRRAVGSVLLATLLFSGVGPIAKLIRLPAETIGFYRALFALLFLGLWMAARHPSPFRVAGGGTGRLRLFGLGLLLAANWFFFILAVQVATVAVAVVALFTYPLMTAILEPVLLREPLNAYWRRWASQTARRPSTPIAKVR